MKLSEQEILDVLRTNKLFEGFSDQELKLIVSLVKIVKFAPGEFIIHENDVCDYFYIIKSGAVEICKFDEKESVYTHLASLGEGEILGEIAIIDREPRSASARAQESAVLLELSLDELQTVLSKRETKSSLAQSTLTESEKEVDKKVNDTILYSLIIHNTAKIIGQKVRNANRVVLESLRRELAKAKEQIFSGRIIISIIIALIFFIIANHFLKSMSPSLFLQTLVNTSLIIFISVVFAIIINKMGYRYSKYGITSKYWISALIENLWITAVLISLIIFVKWNSNLFVMTDTIKTSWISLSLFLISIPFQEFIVRGLLQSSFQTLLTGSHRIFWGIILSNIVFGVACFSFSILYGISIFIAGLLWGWSYARYPSLLGVTFSHIICAIIAVR